MKPMKLYIWEGALADWSGGIIVALAPDLRAAKIAARAAYAPHPGMASAFLENDLSRAPRVVKIADGMPAQAWTVTGGG